MNNILMINDAFFNAYAGMLRSQEGLKAAGEWGQLRPLFPDMTGKDVLDLGCDMGGIANMPSKWEPKAF